MANKKAETKKMLKNMEERKQMAEDMKFYQYKETINNVEYVFQYPGKRRTLQIIDESTDEKGNILKEKLLDNILKTVIVSPYVDLDYFDKEENLDSYDRTTDVANIIFSGKFRNNPKLKQGQDVLQK